MNELVQENLYIIKKKIIIIQELNNEETKKKKLLKMRKYMLWQSNKVK